MTPLERPRCIRRRGSLLALAAVVLFLTTACGRDAPAESEETTPPVTPVPVRAESATLMTLRPSIDRIGTFTAIPERTASVSPQLAGRIQKVTVVEGDAVHAGDELVRIDPRLAEARLRKAKALVDEKQAVIDRLKHGPLPQEVEIARQGVHKSKTVMAALRSKVNALAELHDRDELSEVKYREMEFSLKAAEADYAEAKARLELIEAGTRPEMIAEAAAQLATARADLNTAQLYVEFCRITSPIDGVINRLLARQGMSVDLSTNLGTVVDFSSLFVSFRVPGAYLAKVGPGTAIDARVVSFSNRLFHGSITRLSGQANLNTGDMDAFASVINEGGLLRPGLACRVRVWLPEVADAVAVPTAAVADRAGTPVITVVRSDKAYEIEVTLGVETRAYTQVTQGLLAGDLVVTEGGYGLPDGCPVRILPERPSSQP